MRIRENGGYFALRPEVDRLHPRERRPRRRRVHEPGEGGPPAVLHLRRLLAARGHPQGAQRPRGRLPGRHAPLDGVGARARAHAAGGPRRRGPRPLRHAHADPRGPRRAGPARRALRRHPARRGRDDPHALPGAARPARAGPGALRRRDAAGGRGARRAGGLLPGRGPRGHRAGHARRPPAPPLAVGQGGARGVPPDLRARPRARRAPWRRPPGPPRPRPSRPDGLPRPPGAGLRDPQSRARPRPAAPAVAPGARGRRGEEPPAPRALPVPGLPRLVRRRGLLGPRPHPRGAGRGALRGGLPPDAGAARAPVPSR